MIKKKTKNGFLILILFFSFMFIRISSIAQTSPTQPSDSYDVKIGDSNTYVVEKAQFKNKNNYLPLYRHKIIRLENATLIGFNLTKGLKFKIGVNEFQEVGTFGEQPFVQQTVEDKNLGNLASPVESQYQIVGFNLISNIYQARPGIINPVFENKSSAVSYYNISYPIPNTYYHLSTTISGDFIYSTLKYTANYSTFLMNNTLLNEFNWKTGWLEKSTTMANYANGTFFFHDIIQREGSNSNLIGFIKNFTIITTSIGFALIMVAVIAFTSWSKSDQRRQNNLSFSNYLKNKFKYSKQPSKEKQNQSQSADKALTMIDEILKETKQK